MNSLRNFLVTSEHWGDEFILHNISNESLQVSVVQILTEREAQTISIIDDNSSRKIKNELAEHNGWHVWGKNQSR
jgi:hypothetical protein